MIRVPVFILLPLLCLNMRPIYNQVLEENIRLNINIIEKADSLNSLYLKLTECADKILKQQYEEDFFRLFPNDFLTFISLYGYDENEESGPISEKSVDHIIKGFYKLNVPVNKIYFEKVINISLNGFWQADAVSYFQSGLREKVVNNLEIFCNALLNHKNEEILSFWFFFFDGPHPENYKEDYETLYSKCSVIDPQNAELIKQAYKRLLIEHDGHGH